MENISFQYPVWYLAFCLLLGLIYAATLYYRDKTFREQSGPLNSALGLIRFFSVSFLSMLLLSPLLKSFITEVKKPVVILAQDVSESIKTDMDSVQLLNYQSEIERLSTTLEEDYDLKEYSFGSSVREGIDFDFEDKVSNVSMMLQEAYDLYSNQNLGAIILATDGIYNEGSNPIYTGTKLSTPIYTIALGDTTAKKDLILKRVFHNKIAYLGDKFSIQVDISAQNCAGNNSTLNVYKVVDGKNNRLQQIPLSIDANDFFSTKEIILDADQAGVQRYRITLNRVGGEVSTVNNNKDIFVDVLDARQKILILAHSPHPDISAVKQSIIKNMNYEVDVSYANKFTKTVTAYDFVILHQLPGILHDIQSILNTLNDRKIPHLFVLGTQTNYNKFGNAQSLVNIASDGRNTNDVQANVNPSFSLFNIDENIPQSLPQFAPLLAPFGDFQDNANTEILLYQRIGKVDTKYPLLVFGEESGVKKGVLCAEGIWKWRLFDFLQHQNHNIYDEILGKSIQYLTLKEDKRKFRVSINKNVLNENEPIFFDAELYNESYQLINEPDATITLRSTDGKDYNFTFTKTPKSYTLNAGILPVGNYTYNAKVMSNGKELSNRGQFSVRPIQLEVYETTADHGLLKLLSEKYGGEVIYPAAISSIGDIIKNKDTVKPTVLRNIQNKVCYQLEMDFLHLTHFINIGVVPAQILWSLLITVLNKSNTLFIHYQHCKH